jgi:signal transduction histidine kinase
VLDTKLKSNKNDNNEARIKIKNKKSYIINLIAIVITVSIAMVMIGLYSKIQEIGSKNSIDFIDSFVNNDLIYDLTKNNYIHYHEALEAKQGKSLDASDIYMKPKTQIKDGEVHNQYAALKDNLNNYLVDLKIKSENQLKNLDYAVLDEEGSVIKTNNQNNMLLKDKYLIYITIKFDENGQMNINSVYDGIEYKIKNNLSEFRTENIFQNITDKYDSFVYNPIRNVTFIYGVSKDLKYNDEISMKLKYSQKESYNNIAYIYILILVGIITILSLLIPFKFEKEVIMSKLFFKIPFEIISISMTMLIGFMCLASGDLIFYTLNGDFVTKVLIPIGIEANMGGVAVYIFNIIYWSVFISLIFISVVIIKNIFKMGITNYIKENSIIIKALKLIKKLVNRFMKQIKKMVIYISTIDLTDKSDKAIVKLLAVNFVIISIFCFLWFFGVLLGLVYSIVLFIFLRKYLNNIKNKYEILLDATNKIAEGNLDVKIDEDLGLFNPFKDQVIKIQSGFKKAVNEEVKSQRMKTDLISNVSHDLKTPLTSIITYVDLLKGENVTEEERKAYINTLDKKSQRLKFLIEDLFEVSRATSGNINLNLVKVDIVELMRQTEIELEDKIKNANLKIRNYFSGNKIVLELDSQKTFRIFENLLNNVVKYAMEGSRVYVDIIENNEVAEITIKNMSAEEINFDSEDIVERFQRGDKSRNTEGSGLGLAIVKSFVEVQDGTFNIEVDGDLFKVTIKFKKHS